MRPTTSVSPGAATPERVLDIRDLMGEKKEIRIRHRTEEYRLRLTRNDKLILTK